MDNRDHCQETRGAAVLLLRELNGIAHHHSMMSENIPSHHTHIYVYVLMSKLMERVFLLTLKEEYYGLNSFLII